NGTAGNVGDATVGADISILSGLADGTYTVYIERTGASPNTNCNNIATFTIGNDEPSVTIAAADIATQDNQNCGVAVTDANGFITINAITEDGNNAAYPLSAYSFSWEIAGVAFNDGVDGNLASVGAGTDNSINAIVGGTYTVIVQNTVTGCPPTALEVDITIDDIAVNPTIAAESSTPDTYCDNTGNVGDGTLAIDLFQGATQLDNPTVNAGDYQVEWYRGTLTSRPAGGTGDAAFLFDNQG
ncbi:MAG: hypothetical protein AAFY41_19810, partial [Bacteroidota bacterium]